MPCLAPEGLRPILEYPFETTQGARRFRVEGVYLNSAMYIGGSTVQLTEIVPP